MIESRSSFANTKASGMFSDVICESTAHHTQSPFTYSRNQSNSDSTLHTCSQHETCHVCVCVCTRKKKGGRKKRRENQLGAFDIWQPKHHRHSKLKRNAFSNDLRHTCLQHTTIQGSSTHTHTQTVLMRVRIRLYNLRSLMCVRCARR